MDNATDVVGSSSVSPATRIRLPDLHQDVLFLLFRDYVPLHDKLHTLSKMKEFRKLLRNRACYLKSRLPFSLGYLRLLRRIRPGWYVQRNDWNHRFLLRIDENNLHITLHHFLLDGFMKTYMSDFQHKCLHGSINQMVINLNNFLTHYNHMKDMKILNYYLKGYGLIIINNYFQHDLQPMRFYDHNTYMIHVGRSTEVRDRDQIRSHLTVLFTLEEKLFITCTWPNQGICHCEQVVTELSPITFEISQDSKKLTGEHGTPIPLAVFQDIGLCENKQVELNIIHHVQLFATDILADARRNLDDRLLQIIQEREQAE